MELYDFVFPVVIVILSYAVNEPSVKSRPDFGIFNDFIELKSEEQLKAERHRKRRHFTLGAIIAFLISLIPSTFLDSRWAFNIPFSYSVFMST
jgi:hypothetical protein